MGLSERPRKNRQSSTLRLYLRHSTDVGGGVMQNYALCMTRWQACQQHANIRLGPLSTNWHSNSQRSRLACLHLCRYPLTTTASKPVPKTLHSYVPPSANTWRQRGHTVRTDRIAARCLFARQRSICSTAWSGRVAEAGAAAAAALVSELCTNYNSR